MSRCAAFVGHALVGWAICGTTIAVARQVLSMPNTPLGTSLGFVGIVVGLDAFVAALSLSAVTRCSRVRSAPGFLLLPYGCQASLSAMRADNG